MFKEFKKATEKQMKEKMIETILNCFNSRDMMTLLNEWMLRAKGNSFDGHMETEYEKLEVKISRKPKTFTEQLEWYIGH